MRLFHDVRYGRPITDWKHTDVPPGTQPHRPVLGRPVDAATLERIRPRTNAPRTPATKEQYAVPLVAPRPARAAEVPPSARRMHELGTAYGWAAPGTSPLVYYQTALGHEACVLRLQRGDLGAVAVWERRGPNAKWAYVDGYTRCRALTEQVGSEQFKAWLKRRDERCPDCGGSSVAHHQGECP